MSRTFLFIFLASVFAWQSRARTPAYANNLCNVHNRYSLRVACSSVASALQSAGADKRKIDRLIAFLEIADRRGAAKVLDNLSLDLVAGPVSATAALEYVRGDLLVLVDSGQAVLSLRKACSLIPEKHYCFAYAIEAASGGHTDVAVRLYRELLEKEEERKGVNADPLFKVRLLINLSLHAERNDRKSNPEDSMTQASRILDEQSADDDEVRRLRCILLRRIAWQRYWYQQEYNYAIATYRKALALDQELVAKYPRTYTTQMARDLSTLSQVYIAVGNGPEAESLLRRSVALFETTARNDPGVSDGGWSSAVNHYADFYNNLQPEKSEAIYQHALSLMRPLAKQMPEVYEQDLLATLNSMWSWYDRQALAPEALEIAQEAHTIAKDLWQRNESYGSDLSSASYHLGQSLYSTGEPSSTLCPYLKEALSVAPDPLKASVASTMNLHHCQ